MELLCPECLNRLESAGNSMLRCPTHGGQYQALFVRHAAPTMGMSPSEATGSPCVIHPTVRASKTCLSCSAAICDTCAFEFPGDIQLCPTCATMPPAGLSSERKTLLYTSYGFAVWSTLAIAALFSGALAPLLEDETKMGQFLLIFQYLIFLPALIGTALAIGATEKNQLNTPAIWISIVWNSLLAGSLILLEVIGRIMG